MERDQDEIDELLNQVVAARDQGKRRFPGMSYEDGIEAAIRWLMGETDDHPYPEE